MVLAYSLCWPNILLLVGFAVLQRSYLGWDYSNPELAIAGTIMHGFEFIFVRLAPIVLVASVVGIVITYKVNALRK